MARRVASSPADIREYLAALVPFLVILGIPVLMLLLMAGANWFLL